MQDLVRRIGGRQIHEMPVESAGSAGAEDVFHDISRIGKFLSAPPLPPSSISSSPALTRESGDDGEVEGSRGNCFG